LSRYEGKLKSSREAELDVRELLASLGHNDSAERMQAVARYLSGAEDWHEAMRHLDGAFAAGWPSPAAKDGRRE
jgi:hypothetical protein